MPARISFITLYVVWDLPTKRLNYRLWRSYFLLNKNSFISILRNLLLTKISSPRSNIRSQNALSEPVFQLSKSFNSLAQEFFFKISLWTYLLLSVISVPWSDIKPQYSLNEPIFREFVISALIQQFFESSFFSTNLLLRAISYPCPILGPDTVWMSHFRVFGF